MLWLLLLSLTLTLAHAGNPSCHLQPDLDPHYFISTMASGKPVRMRCADGTLFSAKSCLCSELDPHSHGSSGSSAHTGGHPGHRPSNNTTKVVTSLPPLCHRTPGPHSNCYWNPLTNGSSVLVYCVRGTLFSVGTCSCSITVSSLVTAPPMPTRKKWTPKKWTTKRPCDLFRDVSPRHFLQRLDGGKLVRMRCALGTLYSTATCDCSIYDRKMYTLKPKTTKRPMPPCLPCVQLTFSTNSSTSVKVTNMGVVVMHAGGMVAAFFDGNSYLELRGPGLQFRDAFVLSLRFQIHASRIDRYGTYALADNSAYNTNCTLGFQLTVAEDGLMVSGGFVMSDGRRFWASIPIARGSETGWHKVALSRNGDVSKLRVDQESSSKRLPGMVAQRPGGALNIGRGWGLMYFKGCIDDVLFYNCAPSWL